MTSRSEYRGCWLLWRFATKGEGYLNLWRHKLLPQTNENFTPIQKKSSNGRSAVRHIYMFSGTPISYDPTVTFGVFAKDTTTPGWHSRRTGHQWWSLFGSGRPSTKFFGGQKNWAGQKCLIVGEQQYLVWDTACQSTKWLDMLKFFRAWLRGPPGYTPIPGVTNLFETASYFLCTD